MTNDLFIENGNLSPSGEKLLSGVRNQLDLILRSHPDLSASEMILLRGNLKKLCDDTLTKANR